MKTFFLVVKAETKAGSRITGNTAIKVKGAKPTHSELRKGVELYCQKLMDEGYIIDKEAAVVSFFSEILPERK